MTSFSFFLDYSTHFFKERHVTKKKSKEIQPIHFVKLQNYIEGVWNQLYVRHSMILYARHCMILYVHHCMKLQTVHNLEFKKS